MQARCDRVAVEHGQCVMVVPDVVVVDHGDHAAVAGEPVRSLPIGDQEDPVDPRGVVLEGTQRVAQFAVVAEARHIRGVAGRVRPRAVSAASRRVRQAGSSSSTHRYTASTGKGRVSMASSRNARSVGTEPIPGMSSAVVWASFHSTALCRGLGRRAAHTSCRRGSQAVGMAPRVRRSSRRSTATTDPLDVGAQVGVDQHVHRSGQRVGCTGTRQAGGDSPVAVPRRIDGVVMLLRHELAVEGAGVGLFDDQPIGHAVGSGAHQVRDAGGSGCLECDPQVIDAGVERPDPGAAVTKRR